MKLSVCPLTLKEANDFVLSFHRHNKPTVGGKFAIGAEYGDELVGVAIVGRPIARLLHHRDTAEVLRTCTNDKAPKGCVSFLYAACWRVWREMGGKRIITYTLKSESGDSLRGAGWKVIAEVSPSGNWGSSTRQRKWQPIFGQDKLRWERCQEQGQ